MTTDAGSQHDVASEGAHPAHTGRGRAIVWIAGLVFCAVIWTAVAVVIAALT